MIIVFFINTCFFRESFLRKVFAAAKRVKSEAPRVVCIGDGSKHASLVSAVGADAYLHKCLLKGKYSQVQLLQSPFPAGVTVERLRGLHISVTPRGIIFDFFLLSYFIVYYLLTNI
jgi:hypothetical protein